MKKSFVLFILLVISIALFAQENLEAISDSIVAEGYRLYKSEMASWYGTDIFLEKHKNMDNIGGYLSYSIDNTAKCIFFSKGDTIKVIGTITFDTSYNANTARVDLDEREFTSTEKQLYTIRRIALKQINSDTLFKSYKNTNLNLIPLTSNGQSKVYVLTGPQQNGVVVFGNDYLLNFKDNNEILEIKRLHNNIILINYGNNADTTVVGTMHSHLPETGSFITATDICTLMLYEKFSKWQQHYVISKNHVSIWDCNKNTLIILTMQAWNNINNDRSNRRNKN